MKQNKSKARHRFQPPSVIKTPQDLYETPREAVSIIEDILRPIVEAYPNAVVFDPCDGNGGITNILEEWGYKNIIRRDLYTKEEKHDFLTAQAPPHFDMIIANPPFIIKHKFVLRCVELGKPFALLMPGEWLHTKGAVKVLKRIDAPSVVKFGGRVKFLHDGKWQTMVPDLAWYFFAFPGRVSGTYEVREYVGKKEG
jgi:hypothetical protein